MTIDMKSDEKGVDFDISGKVGDVFCEALLSVGRIASGFLETNDFIFEAFRDYMVYMLDAIKSGEGSDGKEFSLEEFSAGLLRLTRSDPEDAENVYKMLIKKGFNDNGHLITLLAMQTDYVTELNERMLNDL